MTIGVDMDSKVFDLHANMKIAITGGIGSGKSFVCKQLAQRGITVYDCDAAAKRLMRESADLRNALKSLVGDGVYVGDVLQKSVLAKFLLSDKNNNQLVNDVVHPYVASDFMSSGLQWLESAILFDSNFNRRVHFDHIVCVSAPIELRIQRIMLRDGISREQTLEWINRQMSEQEVINRSDYVIVNNNVCDIDEQIDNILKQIYK